MRKSAEFIYRPSGWQLEPSSLHETSLGGIQLWQNGCYQKSVSLEEARKMIQSGTAFAMCEQAIGSMKDGISLA